MASNKELSITLTTAAPTDTIAMDSPHSVSIVGTFGGGTVVESATTETAGIAGAIHAGLTADGSYQSNSPYSSYTISGSTGATVQVILTPVITTVMN